MRNEYIDVELNYAERMVRSGYACAAEAARICGVPLDLLQARLEGLAGARSSFVQRAWEHV